jgi:Tol biopolymer transport system component
MTMPNASREEFDRLMRQWMDADAHVPEPEDLLDRVVAQTRQVRRIPRWLLPERWIPVQLTMRLQTVPRMVPVLLLLIAVLLVAAALVIGLGSWRPLPAPFGPARNGLLAYDTNAAILVSDADGTGARPLVTSVAFASGATFSPDGAKLVFWGDGSPDSLYVANADGTGVRKLSGDLWISTDKPPTWSPDSKSIAFSSESGPNLLDERIYVVDVTTPSSTPRPITDAATVRAFLPAWSPDGNWIAFVGISPDGDVLNLWVVHPDGTDVHSFTTTRYVEVTTPQWAPSAASTRLAYAGGDVTPDLQDIFVIDIATAIETKISTDPANERWPAWSPDGTKLAWLVGGTPPQLRIASIDGAEPARTLASGAMGAPLAWSPDGTKLFAADETRSTVTVVTVDGSAPNVRISHLRGQGLPVWQRLAP